MHNDLPLEFFSSWKETGFVDHRFFAEDFVFAGPSPLVDAQAWMSNSDVELPMEDVMLIESISSGTRTVLLFEGVDPVTLLTYRTAWFFIVRDGKISRLTEARQHIQAESRVRP